MTTRTSAQQTLEPTSLQHSEAQVNSEQNMNAALQEMPVHGYGSFLDLIINKIRLGSIQNKTQLKFFIDSAIVDLSESINTLINQILHHDRFQKIEATWLGLYHLVETQAEYNSDLAVKIKVLNISWRELGKDLSKAIEFDQSLLFQRIYSDEFDTPGGEPFGVIIGDYYVSHKTLSHTPITDVEVLNEIGHVCTAALCPFITGASPSLLGMEDFSELSQPIDLDRLFKHREYFRWTRLRDSEATRFIGLTLPNILLRKPYKNDATRSEQHAFTEADTNASSHYLWGNASFAFGSVLIRAFANTGWFADIRGGIHEFGEGGVVTNLEYSALETDPQERFTRPATNVQIDDLLERELSHHGFIPLCSFHTEQHSVFYSNSSLHDPKHYKSEVATANARMSAMIQYMMCVSRFGHYLKIIGRDRIGSVISAEDCQRVFQNWLNQYTTSSEMASSTIKARYPLSESRVTISEQPGKLGSFNCIVHLKPHFQLDQLVSSIKLVTELSLGKVGTDF